MSEAARPDAVSTDAARRGWLIATTALPLFSALAPRARARDAAVEVDLSDLPPGGLRTVQWRGQPVWVLRRTPAMIAALHGRDDALADPRSERDALPAALRNPGRSIRPDVFVAVAVCTHLGCPLGANVDGGGLLRLADGSAGPFFCPCHGSSFDLAGRVLKDQPATTNLEIPPYRHVGGQRLVIGEIDRG